ncbi:16S rRNA (uracil(1498)-N(3))-methyltransferase [Desulfosporosinus sp.]|uniref:16S rRNA (uracil(1498)-N(3))-methyltransferase n=1 Tax=Desulfosporosinus sp. TaxID=157907 RepID=UPI0025B863BF|nr:16S rRNA (uracil(1498)-N(3))-methyltransferase [Desulfosporosinus sp.]MBC2721064.1 16S rRNA (uracil(1498)-N(3))-methyltransferase [Desulfosporosinus sp.]MBC2725614.1 16S rRNA (uracil(1498)-N(3))-methyltransferase [Desulfosporosinus sp.]
MNRFKITELGKDVFWLRDAEREHLVRVLRLSPGDLVVGYDNTGKEYTSVIVNIEDKSVTCRILSTDQPDVEAHTKVFMVSGLSKGEKMDWVIQKGTELGMAGLVPLRAKRSIVHIEGKKAQDRVVRWQKIASEASKQSHRVQEPKIFEVSDWKDLKAHLPEDTQWLIPYEEEKTQRMATVLGTMSAEHPIAIIIGPEGGFEQSEVAWAQEKLGAQSVTIGPRILRTETAALAALTLVLGHFGDLG